MTNALKNSSLADARLAAAFPNNGPVGAVHIPADWLYIYEVNGQTRTLERVPSGEQPQWITDRPPQAQPANPFETGTYLETTSYTGVGGFRQRVRLRGGQRYVARVLYTVFVVANEPAEDAVRLQTRITHANGTTANDWTYVASAHYRQPAETLTPIIQAEGDGDVLYDFIAEVRYPLVAVKVVIHELFLNEVAPDYGTAVRITPIGSAPPPVQPPPTTPPVQPPPPTPQPPPTLPPPVQPFAHRHFLRSLIPHESLSEAHLKSRRMSAPNPFEEFGQRRRQPDQRSEPNHSKLTKSPCVAHPGAA